MQWRLFSQWDPIKFRWIISCSAPPLWTGIFILRKVWLGKLCWDAQGGSELGNQSEAKLDRPSDQWRVQGRIRVRAWKEAVCLLPSDNILNLISSPWFWLQPFYQQSQLRLAPLRNVTGPSLNESLSRMTLCNPMDYSVHGILQAGILEWVAVPSPGDLHNPGIKPRSPTLQAYSLPAEPPGKPISGDELIAVGTSNHSPHPPVAVFCVLAPVNIFTSHTLCVQPFSFHCHGSLLHPKLRTGYLSSWNSPPCS